LQFLHLPFKLFLVPHSLCNGFHEQDKVLLLYLYKIDKNYNSCEKDEENYDESEHIYTKFAEGSVVWARMTGYPW
jgi:hypothetical protein